jgi:hypothetical protein
MLTRVSAREIEFGIPVPAPRSVLELAAVSAREAQGLN